MMRTLGDIEVFTQLTNELRDTWRGTKDAHVVSLDEGLAMKLRDPTRCCTRVHVKEGDVD